MWDALRAVVEQIYGYTIERDFGTAVFSVRDRDEGHLKGMDCAHELID